MNSISLSLVKSVRPTTTAAIIDNIAILLIIFIDFVFLRRLYCLINKNQEGLLRKTANNCAITPVESYVATFNRKWSSPFATATSPKRIIHILIATATGGNRGVLLLRLFIICRIDFDSGKFAICILQEADQSSFVLRKFNLGEPAVPLPQRE